MFHKFSALPIELRLIIWEIAVSEISRTCKTSRPFQNTRSGLPAPHLAYVCHEARQVVYKLSGGMHGRRLRRPISGDVLDVGFVLPQDIIHLRGPTLCMLGRCRLSHSSVYLDDFIQGHRNLSIDWFISDDWVKVRENPGMNTFIGMCRSHSYLASLGPLTTLMVNTSPTVYKLSLPPLPRFKALFSRNGPARYDFNSRQPTCTTGVYTVNIFDDVVDEIATAAQEFADYTREMYHDSTYLTLWNIIISRETWKTRLAVIRSMWVGLCKFDAWQARTGGSFDDLDDKEYTRWIVERAPNFQPVVAFRLRKPFTRRELQKLADDPEAPSADCEGGSMSWEDMMA